MDYLLPLYLLALGGLVMGQSQTCPDPTAMGNCLKSLQAFEQTLNFFSDKEVLETECRLFNESMQCLDKYLEKCTPMGDSDNLKLSHLRTAINKLCNDPQLKEDLIYNRQCYQSVSNDWADCVKDLKRSSKQSDVCMTRDEVIKCGRDTAVKHCSESAAKSVCKMTVNLMTMMVPGGSCKTDGLDICSSGILLQPSLILLLAAATLGIKNLFKCV